MVVARNLMGGGQKYAGKTLSTMLKQQIKCSTLNIPKHSIAVTLFDFFNEMKKIKFDFFCEKLNSFLDYNRVQREHEEKKSSFVELNYK